MTPASDGKAVPCPKEGCAEKLALGLVGHEDEGYCRACMLFYTLPAPADDEDGDTPQERQGSQERAPKARQEALPPASPVLVRLADVPRQEVGWLREHYLPRGYLIMLDGDPGVGKSWEALALATAMTTGAPLPGQEGEYDPSHVLLLTAEDGVGDTVRGRMEDMGADLNCVTVLTAVRDEQGKERHPSLVEDLPALEEALAGGGYGLVIIDPINAYLGTALDTHRDAALRAVLMPLALLAERCKVAILCIRHLTKSGRDRAIYRGQGSIAYAAAARVVYLVGINPDDETERVMVCIKNNLAPPPPPLAFEIADGHFLWRGQSTVTTAALLAPDRDDSEAGAQEEAKNFLLGLLSDGAVDAEEGWRQARKLGIAERTLKRAKAALRVKAHREGFGPGGRWVWEMAIEGHRGPQPMHKDGRPSMDGSDTKPAQEGENLASYVVSGQDNPDAPACPHRPADEMKNRWAAVTAEEDPHVCRCCGRPARPDLWGEDALRSVCRDGRPVKEGSGHLTRAALDMGARLVEGHSRRW